jgi:hypothetical protein
MEKLKLMIEVKCIDDKVKVIRLNEKGDISRALATNFEIGKTDKFHNQEQNRNITTMGEGCRWWKKNRQSQEMSQRFNHPLLAVKSS